LTLSDYVLRTGFDSEGYLYNTAATTPATARSTPPVFMTSSPAAPVLVVVDADPVVVPVGEPVVVTVATVATVAPAAEEVEGTVASVVLDWKMDALVQKIWTELW
jgi:hypothetical protein